MVLAYHSEVMGIAIDRVRRQDVIEHVLGSLATGRGGRIVTPNVDILRQLTARSDLRPLIESADIVIADGAPVVWASHLQGQPVPERIAGATMVWALSAAAAEAGRKVFLLGGEEGVAEAAARRLVLTYPGLDCDWYFPPFGFEQSKRAIAELVDALARSQPDIVFCGLGFPKQERLMLRLSNLFPTMWFCAVGAGIGFAAGDRVRAPLWMQHAGLEWLHRLGQEPQRLFTRYVVHDMPFALLLLGHALRQRWTTAI
jgi:N-acetylglucosaminyldiphosphoundecaprenol N-acetyl-beta-D-mannosaminyltransferase